MITHKTFCSWRNEDGSGCTNEGTQLMRRWYGVVQENNPLNESYADLPICDLHVEQELDKPARKQLLASMRPTTSLIQITVSWCHCMVIRAQQFQVFRHIVKTVAVNMVQLNY